MLFFLFVLNSRGADLSGLFVLIFSFPFLGAEQRVLKNVCSLLYSNRVAISTLRLNRAPVLLVLGTPSHLYTSFREHPEPQRRALTSTSSVFDRHTSARLGSALLSPLGSALRSALRSARLSARLSAWLSAPYSLRTNPCGSRLHFAHFKRTH